MTIIKEEVSYSDWWQQMIEKYGKIKIDGKPAYNELLDKKGVQTFYRGYNTITDLVKMSKIPFTKSSDEYIYENDLFDLEGNCSSGCVVF